MKIAFIGQKGIPAQAGGVERHVEEVAIRMAKQGHEVFVYVRNNYTPQNLTQYKGVKLIHLPSVSTKNLDAITHTFLATMHALFHRYDVIHYQAIGPSSLSFIPKIFKRKTAIVATFHCQDYYHKKWGWFARQYLHLGEYMACKIPDRTIVINKALRNYVLEHYGTDALYIPNGAQVHYNGRTQALEQWDLKDKRYILAVSRLIKHKGLQYLIEAFKQLEDTNKLPNNFKLVIVGNGFHTDDYVNHLHKISEKRGSIIFTGTQTGSALEQLFSHAYFFVQPSDSEGMSISLLEAMDFGLAPLVSNIPENMETINSSGFSFQKGSVQDLSEKLAYLLNKPSEVERIGRLAKERVQKEYSWDSIVKKTTEAYQNLIYQKQGSGKIYAGIRKKI